MTFINPLLFFSLPPTPPPPVGLYVSVVLSSLPSSLCMYVNPVIGCHDPLFGGM